MQCRNSVYVGFVNVCYNTPSMWRICITDTLNLSPTVFKC